MCGFYPVWVRQMGFEVFCPAPMSRMTPTQNINFDKTFHYLAKPSDHSSVLRAETQETLMKTNKEHNNNNLFLYSTIPTASLLMVLYSIILIKMAILS